MALNTTYSLSESVRRQQEMMLDDIEVKLIELGYLAPDSMDIKRSIYDIGSRYIATFDINDNSYYIIVIVSYNVYDLAWKCNVYVSEDKDGLNTTEEPDETFELIDIKAVKS